MKQFIFNSETFLEWNPLITLGKLLEYSDKEVEKCGRMQFSTGLQDRNFIVSHKDMLLKDIHNMNQDVLVEKEN